MEISSEISAASNEAAAWFFANSDDVFIIVRDGHAVRISPGWTELFGWSEADAIGRPFWDFVHPDDLPVVSAAVKLIQGRGWATYEHRVPIKSGGYRWMRVHTKRATDGAGIVVMQDISARRQRESEAAESAHANSLLNQVAGVRLWRYDPVSRKCEYDPDFSRSFSEVPPERLVSLHETAAGIDRADIPAMEAALIKGALDGEPAVVDFRRQTADGHWRSLRSSWIGSHRLPDGQFEIIGLTQDLTDLMTERDRAVAGEAAAEAASQAKAAFLSQMSHEVRTPLNGLMGALHLAKAAPVNERDALINQALASGADLTSLLSDIVALADGTYVAPPTDTATTRDIDEPADVATLRVLLVDDNPTNLMVAGQMLLAFGVVVETACDGVEAVEAASRAAFDLVLMDIQMPVMDGVEATRRIRALPGPAGQVRIVALTANDLPHQRTLYTAAGMNGCIAKPISPTALFAELNDCASPQPAAA